MIKNHIYKQQEVIAKSCELIHLFYDRNIEPFMQMLHKDFVWIGAYEFQFLAGRKAFLNSIETETQEIPVKVTHEEYHLLAHDRNLWTVYGRFTATAIQPNGTMLMAKVRNTFVWKQQKDELLVMHIHGSHARDVPLEYNGDMPVVSDEDESFFDYLKGVDRSIGPPKRISFRTLEGKYRFLLPMEILYIKAEKKRSIVFTNNGSFITNMALKEAVSKNPLFCCIHRSYMANMPYIIEVQRYKAQLQNGDTLPIGKEKYLNVRDRLQNGGLALEAECSASPDSEQ